ncbi:MAG TPA: ABATE domain-containing protein, partial [Nocardioidaceae bacterium]|nr:ABATE domain-containing protein [Nocardioidaceae bacterium]
MQADPADIVVAFLNTLDVEDQTDVLDEPDRWRDWIATTLDDAAASGPRADRDEARALRAHLRTVVSGEEPTGSPRIP